MLCSSFGVSAFLVRSLHLLAKKRDNLSSISALHGGEDVGDLLTEGGRFQDFGELALGE